MTQAYGDTGHRRSPAFPTHEDQRDRRGRAADRSRHLRVVDGGQPAPPDGGVTTADEHTDWYRQLAEPGPERTTADEHTNWYRQLADERRQDTAAGRDRLPAQSGAWGSRNVPNAGRRTQPGRLTEPGQRAVQ